MIRAIIFDFYGVIYSNFDWAVINKRIYNDINKQIQFRGYIDKINRGELTDRELRRLTSDLAEDSKYPRNRAVHNQPVIDYKLIDYIKRLKDSYYIVLFSNGNKADVNTVLKKQECYDLFDLVLVSSDINHRKPDPSAYLEVIKRLKIRQPVQPKEVLVVDDSIRHISGAKAVGLKTQHYENFDSFRKQISMLLKGRA